MLDRLWVRVHSQVRLRRIRGLWSFVYEHVIPRLVTVGLGLVGLVPCLVGPARQIEGHNDAPVAVPTVQNELADLELGGLAIGSTLQVGLVRHDHTGMIAENRSDGREGIYPYWIAFTLLTTFTSRSDQRALSREDRVILKPERSREAVPASTPT